jgi:serine/threonine-protein kinase
VIESSQNLPTRFGSFYLFDLIGRGGMAEIFLAKTFTSLGTERLSVIKRILPHLSEDKVFCEMLIAEAKLCARLSHANVVHTHDLGVIRDQYYIAMEYIEGFDLNQLLSLLSKAQTSLPLQFGIYIIMETLQGLDYAHRLSDTGGAPLGIIHRDVSPTNVLISTEGDVKVCDFGIAKATMSDVGQIHLDEYHLKGKVAYMAPEAIGGQQAVDRRADLYAAGILLWELLSGRRLYKRKDENETMALAQEAAAPRLVDRGFPEYERLADMVEKALSKNPSERYQSGAEFIDALSEYLHRNKLIVSQLKFADFLMEHFGEDLYRHRREREKVLDEIGEYRERHSRPDMVEPPTPDPDAFPPFDGFEGLEEGESLLQTPPRAQAIPAPFQPKPQVFARLSQEVSTTMWVAAALALVLVAAIVGFFALR